jgi:putative ABC transport system substrate-binding protein
MRRREFLTLVGGAAAWPPAAGAQQQSLPLIGFLGYGSAELMATRVRSFRNGLAEGGIVEGRDATIEYRWAEGQNERLSKLAAELVSRGVNVLVALGSTVAALAAKASTTTIPIVFFVGSDPVQLGLVVSLNRPGGNITGVTNLVVEVAPKRLELLHELMPAAKVFAFLMVSPATLVAQIESRDLLEAARVLGLELHVLQATSERDFDEVFSTLVRSHAALLISTDGFFGSRSDRLAALALRNIVPAISSIPEFVAAGGLISYGTSVFDGYRLAGVYTGRILKGEKPSDLPIQQSTKVELAINLKTAKALGLTVPPALLARADNVIE